MDEVFRTSDPVKLSFVRHLLDEAGIDAYVLDEHTAHIDGRGPLVPMRVMVRSSDRFVASVALAAVEPG